MLVRQSTGANVFVMKSDLIFLAACVAFRTRHRSWNLIRAIAKGRSCLAKYKSEDESNDDSDDETNNQLELYASNNLNQETHGFLKDILEK